jgi:hypothetical protein
MARYRSILWVRFSSSFQPSRGLTLCRSVEYITHVFETANRMITVHALDIAKHNARQSLVYHLVSLARLRTLTSGQVAELLKRYDLRVADRNSGHKRTLTGGSIGFGGGAKNK